MSSVCVCLVETLEMKSSKPSVRWCSYTFSQVGKIKEFFFQQKMQPPRDHQKWYHPSVISSFGHGRTLAWSSPSPKVPKLSKLTTFCLEETGASYSWDKFSIFYWVRAVKPFTPPRKSALEIWDCSGKKLKNNITNHTDSFLYNMILPSAPKRDSLRFLSPRIPQKDYAGLEEGAGRSAVEFWITKISKGGAGWCFIFT